jgi:radical SAM superfamily enzyme YgiQ (UPF0313 family)
LKEEEKVEEKILLALLPFWDPQIPPLGIACLKSFLQEYHYQVKCVDANLNVEFRQLHDDYFSILKKMIPVHLQGNIFNIGNQVLRNHMMAHLNHLAEDKNSYAELLKMLVKKTFFCKVEGDWLKELDDILKEFYSRLRDYLSDVLEREKPTVLGLSVYGDTFPASLAAFKIAKKWNPAIKTIMGGGIFADQLAPGSPDLDSFSEGTKNFIDKIIIGEGEELFLRFLQGELDKSKRVVTLKDIDSTGLDLSAPTVKIPDFSDFDLSFYPHLAHYGARSCPYNCQFCSETVNWGRYRKKEVHRTVKEFIQLYRKYSCQLFIMTDSTLNPIITDLANAFIKSDITIYWDGFLRADRHTNNTENTLLWRRGGFYRAKLGLESGSQRVLDLMNKAITIEQSKKALAALAYAGIKTTTFWLFGFPGETEEDFQKTLEFIQECQDNIYEADCNAFNYYLTGQANSEEWLKKSNPVRLYPGWAKEMLITETWILDVEPSRETAYSRVNRFLQHCRQLGIPNPYSLKDVCTADERWQRLHKNAVPSVIDLENGNTYIDENRHVKEFVTAAPKNLAKENFDF